MAVSPNDKLHVVEVKIYPGQLLIAAHEARIRKMRAEGVDVRLSTELLEQFQITRRLLFDTRDRFQREIQGINAPGVPILARSRLKLPRA